MPGIMGSIEAATTRDEVLFGGDDEHVMNVVLEIIIACIPKASTPLGPCLPIIVANVNTADFYTGDKPIRCIRVDAEASDV
jgi:hypothetical protein